MTGGAIAERARAVGVAHAVLAMGVRAALLRHRHPLHPRGRIRSRRRRRRCRWWRSSSPRATSWPRSATGWPRPAPSRCRRRWPRWCSRGSCRPRPTRRTWDPLGQVHILLAVVGVSVFALAAVLALLYLLRGSAAQAQALRPDDGARDAPRDARSAGAPLRLDRLPHVHGGDRDRRDLGGAAGHRAPAAALRPEYLFALATWAAFGVLLVARLGAGWRGRRAAWLTIGGFGGAMLVLLAYFLRHAA